MTKTSNLIAAASLLVLLAAPLCAAGETTLVVGSRTAECFDHAYDLTPHVAAADVSTTGCTTTLKADQDVYDIRCLPWPGAPQQSAVRVECNAAYVTLA